MDLRRCIPKDKFDLAAIENAADVGYPAIIPILPDLLEWVQDANWPVAEPTALLLAKAGPEIVPYIREILTSDDGMWKYWAIDLVVKSCSIRTRSELQADLVQLVSAPSQNDLDSNVPEVAQAVLLSLSDAD
ncbi:DUF5071 domain-containing protein [Parasedimentitalea maritima]|uniref:DUF5071 domain-containing protein n=1 Tax=Parasedimentitalea maritima TaxID=2578117 RepID=A0A6A4R8Y7_9RHOB|nr:DUF5071 domain-containing protein [Zongyanglinia marina]KAE9628275.1 DUF5071 domain-containing protein [Zongyanglinia marina]